MIASLRYLDAFVKIDGAWLFSTPSTKLHARDARSLQSLQT